MKYKGENYKIVNEDVKAFPWQKMKYKGENYKIVNEDVKAFPWQIIKTKEGNKKTSRSFNRTNVRQKMKYKGENYKIVNEDVKAIIKCHGKTKEGNPTDRTIRTEWVSPSEINKELKSLAKKYTKVNLVDISNRLVLKR